MVGFRAIIDEALSIFFLNNGCPINFRKKKAWVYGPRLAGPRAWAYLCGPSTRSGLSGPQHIASFFSFLFFYFFN